MKTSTQKQDATQPTITVSLSQSEYDAAMKGAAHVGLTDPGKFLWLTLHNHLSCANGDEPDLLVLDFEAIRDRFTFNQLPDWAIRKKGARKHLSPVA